MALTKSKIIFRADGGPSIGMGHFTRTLALAEMLNQHFYCVFVTRQPTEYQITEIEKICHSRIDLPEDDSHFEQFLTYLEGDEIVVLDNYYFTTGYQRAIKDKGCSLVCIDDIHDKHYVADVVINHAISNPNVFEKEPYTQLLLGLEYALIRKPFRQRISENQARKGVLINIGGSDKPNLTEQILDYFVANNLHDRYKTYVLVGNAFSYASSVKEKCDQNGIIFLKDIDAEKLAEVMEYCKYAILPTSTITIEALYKGIIVVGGFYVDNQREFYNDLSIKNYIIPIGNLAVNKNYILIYKALNNNGKSTQINLIGKQEEITKILTTL